MPRGIPKAGYRMTANRKVNMQNQIIERKPSKFSVNERFGFINQFINMVGKKKTNSLIITGDAGMGKSHAVTQNLKSLGLEETLLENDGDFIVIKGFSTPRALYQSFWDNNGKIIVFDDCDNIHRDATASNLLKSGLDSGPNRIMSWGAMRTEKDDDTPNRFDFTGRCIFVSNMSVQEFPQALLSRSYCVDLTLTVDEKIDRIETVLKDYSGKTKEVISFLRTNGNDAVDLSVRSALSILKLANSEKNWERLALYTLTLN
jgi:hypothetical protein